jgi:alpha-amylase
LEDQVLSCNDERLQRDWLYLQTSDHFFYMCSKFLSETKVNKFFSPYKTPFDAFINYMNVLSDFSLRLEKSLTCQQI